MKKKVKIVAVLIAYKAEATLAKFWADFPRKYFDEIILVDDASGAHNSDPAVEFARQLGLVVEIGEVIGQIHFHNSWEKRRCAVAGCATRRSVPFLVLLRVLRSYARR